MAKTSTQNPAPYVGYTMFKAAVEKLAETTVPTGPIDRHVLDHLSGADYGALISCLKFMGYVDGDRRATAAYRELVAARKEDQAKYASDLLGIIKSAYKPIVGDVDIESGTIAQLEKAFRESGVPQGQMLSKAVRFYVKALTDCGVTVSHHITKPKRAPSKPKAKKKGQTKNGGGGNGPDAPDQPPKMDSVPKGFQRLTIPGAESAFIQYPTKLTVTECNIFEAMVTVLRTSVSAREENGG